MRPSHDLAGPWSKARQAAGRWPARPERSAAARMTGGSAARSSAPEAGPTAVRSSNDCERLQIAAPVGRDADDLRGRVNDASIAEPCAQRDPRRRASLEKVVEPAVRPDPEKI